MFFKKQLSQAFVLVGLCLTIVVVSHPVELSLVQAAPEPAKQPEAAGEPLPSDAASLAPTTALTTTTPVTEPVIITVWEETPGQMRTLPGIANFPRRVKSRSSKVT